jgi:hypothetical protein
VAVAQTARGAGNAREKVLRVAHPRHLTGQRKLRS